MKTNHRTLKSHCIDTNAYLGYTQMALQTSKRIRFFLVTLLFCCKYRDKSIEEAIYSKILKKVMIRLN